MKKKSSVYFSSLFFGGIFCVLISKEVLEKKENVLGKKVVPQDTFIIKKKDPLEKKSKNRLKESIGGQMKDVLYSAVKFNKEVGKLQQEVSRIEKNMFGKVEKLIDNKPPFKKATKNDLVCGLRIMQSVNRRLCFYVQEVKQIQEQINKNSCLRKTTG
jgi:hypothetical protein